MVMVEVVARGARLALEILLQCGVILLRAGKVAGFEIGGELVEGLRDGAGSGGRRSGGIRSGVGSAGGLRKGCLQSGKVGLRGGEVAGLEILAELLHVLFVRRSDGAELVLKEATA